MMRDKWSRWHPLARAIAQRLLQRDEPDLTEDEVIELRENLARLSSSEDLSTAARDILYLAAALEHEGLTSVAEKLFGLVEEKSVIGSLDKIAHVRAIDRSEHMALAAKRFAA